MADKCLNAVIETFVGICCVLELAHWNVVLLPSTAEVKLKCQ